MADEPAAEVSGGKSDSARVEPNPSWYGRPIEEVDPLIFEDTFCVISKKFGKNYIFRFSSTKSCWLFGPLNPLRRLAILVTTHRWFDHLIVCTILANCVTLAMLTNMYEPATDKVIEPAYDYYTDRIEYGFLAVFTMELVLKVIAKGFMCHRFSYIRNRWNVVDLIVVVSGYVTIAQDLASGSQETKENDLDFLRTFRVLRVVKTISILPGLKMMINALLSSVVQLLEVMALTFVCLIVFALFAQQLFIGKLRQKCVIDKGGPADDDRLINEPITNQPNVDQLWTEWVSHFEHWKRRDFPEDEPMQCGNASDTRKCPAGYTCIGMLGENPDDGWSNFDTMFNSMLCTFQLITLDYWERLYDIVVSTCGVGSLIFFLLVIFLGAYYLLNLMLAVVAMSYENEVQSNEGELLPVSEKLGMNRRHSNFSFDDLSRLDILKMTQTTKRTISEKARLAVKLRMSGFDYDFGDHAAGEEHLHLDDAIMNIIGMRRTVVADTDDKRHASLDAVFEEIQHGRDTSVIKEPGVEETASQAEVDAGQARRPNFWGRMKARSFACMSKYLQPVVNHQYFEMFITLCIVLNTICLALEHHGMSEDFEFVLTLCNNIFMVVFTMEMVFKLMALQKGYFDSGWNIFDMIIVFVSYMDLAMSDAGGSRGLSVMRSMRLLRVFKLAQSWITMRVLMNIIFSSFGALGNLTAVLLIVIYIFAVMGMQMVGAQYTFKAFEATQNPSNFPKWNWKHFGYAFMLVFRVLCGEWIEPLWDCLKAQANYIEENPGQNEILANTKCFLIFVTITVIGNFIVLNLFLAMLLNSFDTEELSAQRDSETAAHKRAENLKNIVGMLVTKKEGEEEEDEEEGEGEGDSAQLPEQEKLVAPQKGKKISTDPAAKRASSHHVSPAKRRFVAIVNKVLLRIRIAKAERAIAKAENYKKRAKKKILAGMFLTNPGMKNTTFDYDVTPDTSNASENLTGPGECIPASSWLGKYCKCCKRESSRRPSNVRSRSWWFSLRSSCVKIVSHSSFEYSILILIFASSITLAFEDIHLDSKPKLKETLCLLNIIFTAIFGIEMILKIGAIGVWGYFTSFWTLLDAFIVIVSMVSVYFDITLKICSGASVRSGAVANLGALKALRTLRALRPLRAISRWQGMKIVVNALMYAIPSIFNVLLVCLLFWLIFSIMGVQFFKGQFYRCVNDEGKQVQASLAPNKVVCCAKSETHGYSWANTISNYDNVVEGYLSLFQIATFEGWMELMAYSVDATGVDKQPVADNQIGFYFFYVIFIILGSFFTLQLFIGVIIDNFNMLKKKYEGNMLEMMLTPMQRNYYIAMKKLGNKRPRPVITRPKCKFIAIFYDLAMSRKLEVIIFIFIFLNILVEASKSNNHSQLIGHILASFNGFFTIIYTLEALIKIIGLGTFYFTAPWNVYDFILVVLSLADVLRGDISVILAIPPTMLRTVRIVRIGKILRHIKAAQGIRKLMYALVVSLPALFNIGALLALITFIYSILGMALFGKVPKKWSIDEVFNFDTFFNSNLMLLRLMTAAGWNEVLDSMTVVEPVCGTYRHLKCGLPSESECPNRALVVAYIISYLVLTYLIVINLYIAIILENYVEASNEEDVGIVEDDLDMFYNRWARFDPYATQFIKFEELSEFLDSLDPPLQVAKPNIVAIVAFNLPIARGNYLHCLDILQALIKQVLGSVDDSKEFRKLQGQMEHKFQRQFPTRKLLDIVSSTRQWRIEQNAATKIQRYWRAYRKRKLEELETGGQIQDAPPPSRTTVKSKESKKL